MNHIITCNGCDVKKDLQQLETYPWPEDDLLHTDPIEPILELECAGHAGSEEWKLAFVCHSCFHKLQPDMWIDRKLWESISPTTKYEELRSLP